MTLTNLPSSFQCYFSQNQYFYFSTDARWRATSTCRKDFKKFLLQDKHEVNSSLGLVHQHQAKKSIYLLTQWCSKPTNEDPFSFFTVKKKTQKNQAICHRDWYLNRKWPEMDKKHFWTHYTEECLFHLIWTLTQYFGNTYSKLQGLALG